MTWNYLEGNRAEIKEFYILLAPFIAVDETNSDGPIGKHRG